MKLHIKQMVPAGVFAALTVAMSQVVINIPMSPVPITLQVFSVSLAGIILGSRLGALSQLVYVLIGVAGIPVFAGFEGGFGILLGPKGGYIVGFPVLAFITGFLVERLKKPAVLPVFASAFAALAIFYAIGAAWLGTVMKLDPVSSIILGVGWFFPLDVLKLVLASITGLQVRKRLSGNNFICGKKDG